MSDIIADFLWAKSVKGKARDVPGESLDEHSRRVVEKLMQLYQRSPNLAAQLGEPRFWHRAFWACFLHDFGKGAAGFQQVLRETGGWGGRRHEVVSLAFLPWVAALSVDDFAWVAAAIASHHKDAGLKPVANKKATLFELFNPDDLDGLVWLVEDEDGEGIPQKNLDGVADILRTGIERLAQQYDHALGAMGVITADSLAIPAKPDAARFTAAAPQTIARALRAYRSLVRTLDTQPSDSPMNRQAVALRGVVILADRLASSYAWTVDVPTLPDAPTLFGRLGRPFTGLRDHQEKTAAAHGSIILTAPTGSGKTEAALLWAYEQQRVSGRRANLVYVLPYQASMNAMFERLARSLFDEAPLSEPATKEQKAEQTKIRTRRVALMHGRSTQVLYKQLISPADTPANAEKVALRARNMAGLYQPSVWVATPYQLLKAAYRLPGYEMLWTAVAGARLIVDEIHAYDPERLGLFIGILRFLKEHWYAELCVMTATMPNWLRDLLREQLGIGAENHIVPADALFAHFRRHILYRLEGTLADPAVLDFTARQFAAGRSVLVCANTVASAQATLTALRERVGDTNVMLLHSRFTGEDRQAKEETIQQQANADRKDKTQPFIVVATQVIEVSLDLDFNTIVTEPAPLEALAQRFGRVNRRGTAERDPAPVYVLTAPTDSATELIYDADVIHNTLALLERVAGEALPPDAPEGSVAGVVLDEKRLSDWLTEIYEEGDLAALFKARVLATLQQFNDACVKELRAFQSDPAMEEIFESLFDGAEVLPISKTDAYKAALAESAIEASRYLVPISSRQRKRFFKQIQPQTFVRSTDEKERDREIRELVADFPYNADIGLQFPTKGGNG